MRTGIAFRLGILLASFSVLAASLAAYYTFDAGRSLLQGLPLQLMATQAGARAIEA